MPWPGAGVSRRSRPAWDDHAAAAQYSAFASVQPSGRLHPADRSPDLRGFPSARLFPQWAEQHGEPPARIVPELLQGAVPASIPIIAFLVMASIMKHSRART